MSKINWARWGLAVGAAIVAYVAIVVILPALEKSVPGMSPMLLALSSTTLATGVGVSVGGLMAPRDNLRFAKRFFFFAGILAPIGRGAYELLHNHAMTQPYLIMIAGAFAGGMVGLFILILPAPAKVRQPRQFN